MMPGRRLMAVSTMEAGTMRVRLRLTADFRTLARPILTQEWMRVEVACAEIALPAEMTVRTG